LFGGGEDGLVLNKKIKYLVNQAKIVLVFSGFCIAGETEGDDGAGGGVERRGAAHDW
jgi:hypothetical protein